MFDYFNNLDVFVDVIGVHAGLVMVAVKGHSDYADEIRQKVHKKRDNVPYDGVYLTTVDLSFEMAQSFSVPNPHFTHCNSASCNKA